MGFQLTIMGGADARLHGPTNLIITLMGGTEVKMPTMADKIIALKRGQPASGSVQDTATQHVFILTILGGTELKYPTMAREIEEMIRLRQAQAVSDLELRQLWHEVIRRGDEPIVESVTLMGGVEEGRPSTKDEVKDLERIAARGFISAQELQEIRSLIGKESFPAMRVTLLQQRLQGLLAPPSAPSAHSTHPIETSRLEAPRWGSPEE